jgi:hypothetical protein
MVWKLLTIVMFVGVAATPLAVHAQPATIERDIVYGHMDGMTMVYDVSRPSEPNGAGVIFVVS